MGQLRFAVSLKHSNHAVSKQGQFPIRLYISGILSSLQAEFAWIVLIQDPLVRY